MINLMPVEITICAFSLVGVLTGYIWNEQEKKICKNAELIKKLPLIEIETGIVEIKNDIVWIKKFLNKD